MHPILMCAVVMESVEHRIHAHAKTNTKDPNVNMQLALEGHQLKRSVLIMNVLGNDKWPIRKSAQEAENV